MFTQLCFATGLVVTVIGCALPSCGDLTIEERVGQVLMVHVPGETISEEARELVSDVYLGGVIYYEWSNGLVSPEQIRTLSEDLQAAAPIPLLIAVDQEGGRVARCKKGFTAFPGNGALGEHGRADWAEASAAAIGRELLAVGINTNLAPVVDINSVPDRPVMNTRSFGSDPALVAELGGAALRGYREAGVLATLKHYPGYGGVTIDAHLGLPVLTATQEEMDRVELLPFARLAPQTDMIMTAHVVVPHIDPTHCATLSKPMIDLLRNQIGFDGVVITDSLVMEGLLADCSSIEEAARRALEAGCDIVLLGGKQLVGASLGREVTPADCKRIHAQLDRKSVV